MTPSSSPRWRTLSGPSGCGTRAGRRPFSAYGSDLHPDATVLTPVRYCSAYRASSSPLDKPEQEPRRSREGPTTPTTPGRASSTESRRRVRPGRRRERRGPPPRGSAQGEGGSMRHGSLLAWSVRLSVVALIATACGGSATPTPSAAAPSAAAPSAGAPSAAAPSAASQNFAGVSVNVLTFNGPQIAEPLQRRAPDSKKLTGANVNVTTVPFSDLYTKALTDVSTGTNSYDAYVFDPQWMGDFVGPRLPGRPDRTRSRTTRTSSGRTSRPFFRDFSATLQRQDLHDPARRRLPHGLLPERPAGQGRPQAARDLGRLPDDRPEVQRPGPQRRRHARLRLVHREEATPRLLVDHLHRRRLHPEQGHQPGRVLQHRQHEAARPATTRFAAALEIYKKTGNYGPPDELNDDVGARAACSPPAAAR